MEKTKFGISTALLAAIVYLACYYGGIVATLVAVGAVLILETNTEMKKHALRAAILLFAFAVFSSLIYLLPNFITCISNLLSLLTINFDLYIVTRIASAITGVFDLLERIVFLGLAALALFNVNIKIPGVDGLIEKLLNK